MNKTLLSVSALLLVCTSCGSISRRNSEEANAPAPETDSQKIEKLQAQNKELTSALTSLTSKLDGMESKLNAVNAKLDAAQSRVDNLVDNQRAKPGAIKTVPTEGARDLPPAGDDDAEAAFTSDEPVRKYRQAMILFQSRNYPDASLGFSSFVDQYPDHPLAGSAQFYLGESYFKQGEFKLAARELGRVITTYDRSPHIAETLRDLAISEEKTGQSEEAARHRQLLSSLFPHSPAAHAAGAAASEAPEASEAKTSQSVVDAAPKTIEKPAAEEPAHVPQAQAVQDTQATQAPQAAQTAPTASGSLDAPPPTAPMAPSGVTQSPAPALNHGSEK